MNYTYEIDRPAHRYLQRLSPQLRNRILTALRRICEDPLDSRTSAPLHGQLAGLRRTRVGEYRLVFRVETARRVIVVTLIGPRGDVYRV